MDRGVMYISTGEDYLKEAIVSAKSVRRNIPNINITLISEFEDPSSVFDNTICIDDPSYSLADKVENIHMSPYEHTIFLDTDTYICDESGINDLFELLEEFDFAACHGLGRRLASTMGSKDISKGSIPASFPWYNSGVLAFRDTEQISDIFTRWREIHRQNLKVIDGVLDQAALRESLYESDVRIATIPFEYNYHIMHPQSVGDRVHILHGHVSNFTRIETIINKNNDEKRFFVPEKIHNEVTLFDTSSIIYGHMPSPIRKTLAIRNSVRSKGVRETGYSLLKWINGESFW